MVTGYGSQEKKEITSAVTSVKSEDFNRGTVNDPAQLLQGKVAGLSIVRPGGDPNGGFNIRLRGISTFGANTEPLIVIDGVIGASLSTVDPNDISSMDVLKDGSAAAIYGTRGGSGVIIITTKSGKAGRVNVDYNASYATEEVARTIDFMSADEYNKVPGVKNTTKFGKDTDWLDVVTRRGSAQVHNLSVSGGTQKTTYRASVNLRDAQGIAINSGFQQLNTRLNLTQKALNNRATFSVNLTTTTKDAEYGFKESLRYAIIANPTMPVYDNTLNSTTAGGRFGGYAERDIFDFFNPLSIAEQNKNEGKDLRILANIRGEYDFDDFVKGLRFTVSYSQQDENDLRGQYYAKTSKFRGFGRNGLAGRQTNSRNNKLFETTLNYVKDFDFMNMTLLGGYSYQEFFNQGFGAEGGNFLTDAFTYNNLGAALDFKNGLGSVYSYANSNKLVAFFGRANLNYKNNFFVSASARYEGSTRFGANEKFGLFPAVSAGVNLSNLVSIPSVNSLKLRASWGVTGNQPSDSYVSLLRFGPTASSFFYNGAFVNSYAPVSNANPNLKWETKTEYDFGIDFALFNNKLTGTFDYYNRVTKDLYLYKNVPVPPNLFGQTLLNIGELSNSGLELALNYNVISGNKFSWTTGGNIGTVNMKVTKLTSPEIPDGNVFYTAGMGAPGQNAFTLARIKEGTEFGQLWGPIQEGINANGTPKFADLDKNGSYCDCDADKTVIGNGLPKFTFGWNNSLKYGNWDANFFFRGAVGHDILNSYRGFYENTEGTTLDNYNVVNTKFFDANIKKAAVNNTHVEKGDFIKLDNATIGYNVAVGQSSMINKLRVFVSGQNLFVISKYTGIDPEVRWQDQIDG
ncbi:MAG: SusC/RagA family TonB-linked outer membrane protein, partial [Bacteroidota bacterium]